MRRRTPTFYRFTIAIILMVVVAGTYYFSFQRPILGEIKQGLDLQGGTRLVLQAFDAPDRPVTQDRLQATVGIIRDRVDSLGLSEPNIAPVIGEKRIIVELAGVSQDEARDIVSIANLEFRMPDPVTESIISQVYSTGGGPADVIEQLNQDDWYANHEGKGGLVISGKDLIKAEATFSQRNNEPIVALELSKEGQDAFGEATTRALNRPILIVLDGRVHSAPFVSEPGIREPIITFPSVRSTAGSDDSSGGLLNRLIPGGEGARGDDNIKQAVRLAAILNTGALPLELKIVEVREVSASLGQDSIQASKAAGLIGIAAVVLFMIVAYRLSGLLANLALTVYVFLVLFTLWQLNAVITLPGVAGLVLSIGMAVDANVIIFERIKEEIRNGRTLASAVEAGFQRAFRTILDSNVTTLIATGVLYRFGTGPVRGFAVTLSIGIIASMLTAVVVTRYLLRASVGSRLLPNARLFFGIGGEAK